MMSNKPPYTITEKAADYLAKIVETVTRLEFGTGFTRDIQLHRENRVRTIHSSLAIEGNSLSLSEVTAVIDGKVVAGKQAEVKEVKNAYEAYDKIMTFDPYSNDDFLTAHRLMTEGLVKESGKFRSGDVGVFDGDRVIHTMRLRPFTPLRTATGAWGDYGKPSCLLNGIRFSPGYRWSRYCFRIHRTTIKRSRTQGTRMIQAPLSSLPSPRSSTASGSKKSTTSSTKMSTKSN